MRYNLQKAFVLLVLGQASFPVRFRVPLTQKAGHRRVTTLALTFAQIIPNGFFSIAVVCGYLFHIKQGGRGKTRVDGPGWV